ncbi:disease resistance-like protein DSC1 [Ziziphus jujuba]|uniref:ADP-ribosyl cyclase/cyclic ADP-ribose hydrolase n=1 Tax=Ziziphus jujuba TaxID=326968 RepID=A0ABM4AC89_ZIZJJ|nr:disease resistance-like protein DSC1 [Ziziphus jujuba]
MGGIGKTTLASVVYQRLSYSQFKGCCFIWNVREEYARHGANHLRKKLLSELLNDEAILKMDSPFVASPCILDRLRHTKVLIVLDDVDSSNQLEALVEGYYRLAPGSRIIVTTRNMQVLKKVTDRFYKVELLNHAESLELFRLHAFGKNSPVIDDEMVLEVTRYANGNPLALKVLGSFLHSKSKEEWKIALNKLKIIPNREIQDVLKISYEGLDDKEIQSIFLDIACLFDQSFTRDHVESILKASDPFVKIAISVLIDRSLIENRVSPIGNKLWMHDLIRQMGRTIVCDEHKEPGNRSRLWDPKDICHVLERDTGTAMVEGISLNMCRMNRDVKVHRAAFSMMYNLRIFKIFVCHNMNENKWYICDCKDKNKFKLYLPQGLDSYLSDKLNYFQWDLYPLRSLPSHVSLENLVELILRGSRLQRLWNHGVQSLLVLRKIDLSYSKMLNEIPDMSLAPNLESINFEGCTSLVKVLSSVENLHRLTYLNLNSCSKLRDLKEISRNTWYWDIVNFINNLPLYSSQAHIYQTFPVNLTDLHLDWTAIEEVPPSIWHLSSLVRLDLNYCSGLESISTSICKLISLESQRLCGCVKLFKFPEILEPMEHLTYLELGHSPIQELPESIKNLVSLRRLCIFSCKNIEFLPTSLCNLRKLEHINIQRCSNLKKLPPLPNASLSLLLDHNERLKSLPELPSSCFCLSAICCTSLETIPNWKAPLLHHLSSNHSRGQINFYGCEKLDQNTRNIILAGRGIFQILSGLKFGRMCDDFEFCYPGDEIPKWFSYQSGSTSMNIRLPPYWNNDNFLGLAFCVVIYQHKIIDHPLFLGIGCKLNFKTIPDSLLCEHDSFMRLGGDDDSSDHVVMWYVEELTLQNSGLSWRSNCCTMACLHLSLECGYCHDVDEDVNVNYNDDTYIDGNEYGEIKKFGVWFVYKEDIERFDVDTKSKNKRRFDECCETSGSEGSHGIENDVLHSKKLKVMSLI